MNLRDGTTTEDVRLDRLVQFDEKSRKFPVRMLVGEKPLRSYTWASPFYLDQGREGACVGFSTTHKLSTRYPAINMTYSTNETATRIYKRAQQLDPWEGEDYEGTSVLGGIKAAMELGYIKSYYWAFTLQEALLAIGYNGGGVFGTNWYTGMFKPDANGFIHPTGSVAGGHAILVSGVNIKKGFVRLHNSWGKDWGVNGDCFLTIDDFARLLKEDGEFCVPVRN